MAIKNEIPVAVVINNNHAQLELLKRLLVKADIEVNAYPDAETALTGIMSTYPPDLIVTDINLPGIDGWRLCRLLRSSEYEAFNNVPILVVSATFSGDHPEPTAMDTGADAFLPVPLDEINFITVTRSLLEGKETRRMPRVLIVEQEPQLTEELRKAFQLKGYNIDSSATVNDAKKLFNTNSYEAAVIAYHLPDDKGDTLLDYFLSLKLECVCLMMTKDPTPELALSWMRRGASAYLHKPFDPACVIDIYIRACRERELLRVSALLEERTLKLQESEERYRRITESITDYIYTCTVEKGEVVRTVHGPGSVAVTGFSSQEYADDPYLWFRMIHHEDIEKVRNHASMILKGESYKPLEHRIYLKNGDVRWVSNTPVPRFDSSGMLVSYDGLIKNITERKKSEEEHIKLQNQLNQAQKMESVGRLAGGVAHDFNNMMGVIMGHTELAMESLETSDPIYEDLDEIMKAATRSADLTRQLLAFARKQTISPKVLDLNETVESILKMLRRLIGEDIDLVWIPGNKLWPVMMDPSQIDQILANLCVNARDAIVNGGRVSIETGNVTMDKTTCAGLNGFKPGDYVMLAVGDNGCGMDKDILSHLFEPFFTTKSVGKGTGLGLATVYGAVKQNNGFINVLSEPGQGTTFKIYLPRHRAISDQKSEPHILEANRRGSETILLVEDEPVILKLAGRMLKNLGYTVLASGSPGEAVRLAKEYQGKIDLIMTDVIMPEMNGRDLVKTLSSICPDIKKLFMSGYTADVIAHHGVLDEGIHYIQKPFTMHDLAASLKEALKIK